MSNLADGYTAILQAALRGARPDPELEVDKWSEQHILLPKSSPKPGNYRIEYTPMARRVLQCLSPRSPYRRVMLKCASQLFKTQVAINFLLARAHRTPANMILLEPNTTLAKRVSTRIQEIVRISPELSAIFAKPRSRDSRNTVFEKQFDGGTLYIGTAASTATMSELSAPFIFIDELRELWDCLNGQGDPIAIAEARMTSFGDRGKILLASSPGAAGADPTDAEFERGTQEVYVVPCPHCGHHHDLVLENFRYARDPETNHMARAWFVCPECGAEIEEQQKTRMFRDADLGGTAHWYAKSLGDGITASFHAGAFYAAAGAISWRDLAREHAYAEHQLKQGDPNKMAAFYNTRLGLSWSNSLEQTTAQELKARADLPPRVVPHWASVVTIDTDTQHDRLEVQAEAWGPGGEHAVIDYEVLYGPPSADPADPQSVWARLDAYRRTPFAHASGVLIPASVCGIDSGGLNTQDVYNFGSGRVHNGVLVHHGASRPNRPIIGTVPRKVDIDWNGKRVEGGALLWEIGTDVAKEHLFNRLKLLSGWGAMHFNTALPDTWRDGFLAERPILKRKPGGGYRRYWEKHRPGDRNEPLDLAVGNLALFHYLGLHKWSAQDWARLRKKLGLDEVSVTPDLFVQVPAVADAHEGVATAAAPAAPAPPPTPAPVAFSPQPAAPAARRMISRGQY